MSTPTDMSAPTDTSAPADAIEAEGLSVRYGARRVLEGVALRVSAGEFVGLLGPNGAGKSTLLRLLLGLQRPESGRVLLGGAPLGSLSRREAARRAAFVPQQAPT
ncbi:MAG: ATP-binding cassette domain-containing protein, partial [Myxococcales bacterium]|nr:ATP-binding cassette domain-containing protein [Myxococcales bacterium]